MSRSENLVDRGIGNGGEIASFRDREISSRVLGTI